MSYYMLLEFYKFGDMGIKKKKKKRRERNMSFKSLEFLNDFF